MTTKFWIALTLAFCLVITPIALAESAAPAETAQIETASAETETPEETTSAQAEQPASGSINIGEMPDDTVIATVDGLPLTKGDIMTVFNVYAQQAASMGMDMSAPESQQSLFSFAANTAMRDKIVEAKGIELGLNEFTPEELAMFNNLAQAEYDNAFASLEAYAPVEEQGTEEAKLQIQQYFESSGYTPEKVAQAMETDALKDRVLAYATKDVTVTDEDVQAAYDAAVESAKARYAENLPAFASDSSGSAIIYYTPEGYRAVKHILVGTEPELYQLKADLEQAGDDAAKADIQTQIDALLTEVQPKLDEIAKRIEAGEDFQTLIDEFGEDGGMKSGTTAETGYYMCEGTSTYVPEFTAGGMALEKVGDISEPILTNYGYHIIRYHADVPAGSVAFEAVEAALKAQLLSEAQNEAFADAVTEWASNCTIEYTQF